MARAKRSDNLLMIVVIAMLIMAGFLVYQGDKAGDLQYSALATAALAVVTMVLRELLKDGKDDADPNPDGDADVSE